METDKNAQMNDNLIRLAAMVKRVSDSVDRIEKTLKQHDQTIEQALEQSSQSEGWSDDSAWEGFGSKPEKTPINPNAEQYTLELHHGPYTIYRHDGESDKEWTRRKDHLMDQRVTFLNGSGQNATPEQVAYLKRIEERLGRKVFQYPLATT
jgi:hypothetical protein